MRRDVLQHQPAHGRDLVGDEMAAAGQHLETIGATTKKTVPSAAGRPHRHRSSSCKAWGRGSGRAASGWLRRRDTMQARPPWSPCYRAQRCFSIALAGTSAAVHRSQPPCKSVQQQQEWPRRARAIRAYRMSNREKSKSSIGSSPCAAPRTRVFEVDILNDRRHAEYLTDQWGPGPRGKLLEGANVVMGFHETFLESEKAPSKNKPHGRFVTFAAMAHNPSTDERCNISFTGFNADPAKVPGKYKDKKLARSISRKLSVTGDDASTLVSESFDVDTGDGSIHFAVDYSRQQPLWLYATAVPPDAVVFRAAADPSGRRIYWEDTLNYIILSRPASIDVTSKLEFKIDVPGLRDVAAGSETVAVIVRPYLFRRVFSSK